MSHRSPAKALTLAVATAAVIATLAACGSPGSSSGSGATTTSGGSGTSTLATCAPIADKSLVVLTDDKHLQTVDNIIPAANAKALAGDEFVMEMLDDVSSVLTTDKLIALNKAVDVDRKTSAEVAKQFIADEGLKAQDTVGNGKKIVVGASNFSESATLAQIYAQVLSSAGYNATVQTVDARETYLPALEKGQLTVFPEYVGTLTEYLNKSNNGADAKQLASGDLDSTVKALTELGKQRGLTFGKPSAAQDQNAYAVTKAFADKYKVKTLSELASTCGGIVLGAGPECTDRPFCQPGLEQTYGIQIAKFDALDTGGPLTKAALQQGQISLGLVFSSDGQLG